MKPFGALLSFEEAKKVVDAHITPITRVETVNIIDALGRVLADDVVATLSSPPFDRAAMDGYAVKARDTFNAGRYSPKILKLAGELRAGEMPQNRVSQGECIQISTGAIMPRGADAVVMVEDTESGNQNVKVFKSAYPGANVASKGEDIKEGETILRRGAVLDPAKIGALTSQGIEKVRVYEKPRAAVLPTGSEIGDVGGKLKPGQIYDINSYTVSSVVKANGGIPVKFPIIGDDPEELNSAITEALKNDLVVISGGSSVGVRDLLFDVLQKLGQVLFHGIQVKPGKPTIFAVAQDKPVFGMPGFPTSCLMNAYLFIAPSVRKMAQLPPLKERIVEARLSERIPGSVGRRQFFTVRLEGDIALPAYKESGAITSMSQADGYIEIPENIDLLEKGTVVTVKLF